MPKSFWVTLIFFCAFILKSPALRAQQSYDVGYSFEADTVRIKGGETFANKLLLYNTSAVEVVLTSNPEMTGFPEGLLDLPDTIRIPPAGNKMFPIKYIADRRTLTSQFQEFRLGLISPIENIAVQPSASFFTLLDDSNSFRMQADQTEYYLDPGSDQVQLFLRCTNTGFVPVTFRLDFSEIPDGLEMTGEEMYTTLGPGEQIMLPYTGRDQTGRDIDFDLRIEAVAEDGDLLALQRVRVMSIGSVQRFGTHNSWENTPNNSVALQYLNIDQTRAVYQFMANGDLVLGKDKKLDYRLNVQYNDDLEGIGIYNTYMDYQDISWGVKIGNIHENLDHLVGGRGLKATYKISPEEEVSVYGVENRYMLLSPVNRSFEGEKIFAADYSFRNNRNKQGHVSYVHSNHDLRGLQSNQVSWKSDIDLPNLQTLSIEGGLSQEELFSGSQKPGFSAGFDYNTQGSQYQFNSNTYYSSPYFTGLRRGFFRSDNRLRRALEKQRYLSARLSITSSNPKYQEGERGYRFSRNNRTEIYQLGYSTPLGNLHLDVRPYYMAQYLSTEGAHWEPLQGNWRSGAFRTAMNVRFSKNVHSLSLNTDYGYNFRNTSKRPVAPFHSLKVTGNYSNAYFGFSTHLQINPYYLSDILSTTGNEDYRRYSFGPNTRFSALNQKLEVQLSGMYSYYGFSGSNNFSMDAHIQWLLKRNWRISADVFYSVIKNSRAYMIGENLEYVNSIYDHNQIRFGVEKKFSKFTHSAGNKLELLYFQDHNNNGIREPGELPAEGVLVKIEKEAARTAKNGTVKFKNMLPGAYRVEIINSNGWSIAGSNEVLLSGNLSLEVPLVRTRVLKGKINLVASPYLESNPRFAGIKINAVDAQGNAYSTLCDANGNYSLYLPPSSYKVFIDTNEMPFSILNNMNEVEVTEQQQSYTLNFQYQDNRRRVEVKRF